MEPIIKEKETVYTDDSGRGGSNNRGKVNAALATGIIGTVLGGAALARQGGIAGILGNGGGAAPTNTVVYNSSPVTCPSSMYAKECEDILNVTKGMYDLYIAGSNQAAQAREIDVAEKFGLYVNNRDSIDKLSDRTNAEFFSLYKYTRDKDDETNAKIYDLAQQVAINTAVRPYQDALLQTQITNAFKEAINYVDRKTCKMVTGVTVIPTTPTISGYGSYCCGNQVAAATEG